MLAESLWPFSLLIPADPSAVSALMQNVQSLLMATQAETPLRVVTGASFFLGKLNVQLRSSLY
jgi:hypothetical protein